MPTRSSKGWYGEAAGEWLRSDGYITVGEDVRGAVDVPADSDYQTGFFGGGYNPGNWHAGVRMSLYAEDRNNGTPLQVNTTDWKQVAGDAGGSLAAAPGSHAARAAAGVLPDVQRHARRRGAQRRAADHRADDAEPVHDGVGPVDARLRARRRRWSVPKGAARSSTVEELRYRVTNVESGPFLRRRHARRTARCSAASASCRRQPLTIVLGGRGDFWKSTPADTALPEHEAEFFSPRASASWRVSDAVSIHGAGYRSHRTPTLNELYRGFRVGASRRCPNPALNPETLTGGEGGVLFTHGRSRRAPRHSPTSSRNAITNVTIGTNLRERQNTDTIVLGHRGRGDVRLHIRAGRWRAHRRDAFAIRRGARAAGIEGNQVPQVPTFQLGGSVTYSIRSGSPARCRREPSAPSSTTTSTNSSSQQYGVVDLSASQQVLRGLNVFVAVENLFDEEYDTVGRAPLRTVGWPRTARVGVRVFLP